MKVWTLRIFFLYISDHAVLFGEKSIFSIFPTPQSVFLRVPIEKHFVGSGKSKKNDFLPNKTSWSEMHRKNIRKAGNNEKTRYFDVSNRILLI